MLSCSPCALLTAHHAEIMCPYHPAPSFSYQLTFDLSLYLSHHRLPDTAAVLPLSRYTVNRSNRTETMGKERVSMGWRTSDLNKKMKARMGRNITGAVSTKHFNRLLFVVCISSTGRWPLQTLQPCRRFFICSVITLGRGHPTRYPLRPNCFPSNDVVLVTKEGRAQGEDLGTLWDLPNTSFAGFLRVNYVIRTFAA